MAYLCQATSALAVLAANACAPAPSKVSDVMVRLPTGDCRIGSVCAVDFGAVELGTSEVRAFSIINAGTADDAITRMETTGDLAFSASEDVIGPLSAGGGAIPLAAAFTPRNQGQANAQWMVHTSSGVITLQLTAAGTAGSLAITTMCDFGDVPVGTPSAPCGVVILNGGAGPVVIDSVQLVGAPFAAQGIFVAPLTIPAGQEATINIIATPATAGLTTGSLTLVEGGMVRQGVTVLRVNGV